MSFALFGWILPTAGLLQAGTLSQNRSPRAAVMKSSDGKAPTETDTVDDNNISAKYVFGTIQSISGGAEGKFVIEDPRQLTFVHGDSQWQLSYTSITKIEKGDLLERRFGIPYVPKRRRESVTIYFVDSQGRPQRVTFERISGGFRLPLIPRTSALSKWTGRTGSSGFTKSRRILDLFLHGLLGH
jgi:hypothetical protein